MPICNSFFGGDEFRNTFSKISNRAPQKHSEYVPKEIRNFCSASGKQHPPPPSIQSTLTCRMYDYDYFKYRTVTAPLANTFPARMENPGQFISPSRTTASTSTTPSWGRQASWPGSASTPR
jgi:hypothetical protein